METINIGVVERETGLQDAAETGVPLNAELSVELLETVFTPHAPLHDGAVIVRNERVIVPRGDTMVRSGDEVLVLVTSDSEDEVKRLLTGE